MTSQPIKLALACAGVLALTAACSARSAQRADPMDEGGQLITAETIRQSGLSNGWEVLRRFGEHLSISDHERGPVRVARRGRESLYLVEAPLLIIDNVKVSNFRALSTLPARDIASMRILTGAEGSLRHGMHAASGVIIVHTIYPDPAGKPDSAGMRRIGR